MKILITEISNSKLENENFQNLVSSIAETNLYFQHQAQKQVNIALTLRNWLIGAYLVKYEQNGEDRAKYGEKTLQALADALKLQGFKGLSKTNLKLFRKFYFTYPSIGQSVTDQFKLADISQSIMPKVVDEIDIANKLLTHLSFTHLVELLKNDTETKRVFYETFTIQNNWSVRELQRAMNSLLFERTGLSSDKEAVLAEYSKGTGLQSSDYFRSPYVFEFVDLDEKNAYTELDLEQAIINHLQSFLLELGNGFCFEARQKRITFGNTHYRIDLVFYHRILRCHVLIDLKIGEFNHADAGQMNVYLNYYADNEMREGDNPPIGIILCADKDQQLVKYATAGMSQQVMVSKYLVNLPTEDELRKIIQDEQEKSNY